MLRLLKSITVLLMFLVCMNNVLAAETVAPTLKDVADKQQDEEELIKKLSQEPQVGPKDEFKRGTPRSSILALSQAIKDKDFERAENYLDLRNLPFSKEQFDAPTLVRKLHIIAKRVMNMDLADLSNDPMGHKNDGLPSYRDRATSIETKNGTVDIMMQRVPRGDGVFIWKVSNATVALIPQLYEEFGYGPIGDKLSTIFPQYTVLGLEIWQWVMLAGIIFLSILIAYALTFVFEIIAKRSQKISRSRLQAFIRGPLRFLIFVLLFRAAFDQISPTLVARAVFESRTLLTFAVYWILLGIIDLVVYRFAERMRRNGQEGGVVLLRPAALGVKLIIGMFTALYWFDNLGYEVTTLLAGLGVGGIAIALAAQKSLENLIGAIMIYTSQPVRVGDFCKFKNTVGTVEEIGLRSTQLRTLDRTVVHIPNAMFSAEEIENLTQRDKILYRTRLRVSYEVEPDKIRGLLSKIREMIDEKKFIDEENSRVRFLEFGKYSQELELFMYLKTSDFAEYLQYREDVNLMLVDILAAMDVKLTLPAHTTHVSDGAADMVTD